MRTWHQRYSILFFPIEKSLDLFLTSLYFMQAIKNPYLGAMIIGMGSIALGMPMSYCSVTLPPMTTHYTWDETTSTWFNTAGLLCAAFGGPIMGPIVNKVGLRWGSFITGLISGLTFILLGACNATWLAFIGRCINGLTVGFTSCIMPVFLNEIAPDHLKGLFGYLSQLFICIGFLVPTLFDFFSNWRQNYYIMSVFPWILFVGCLFVKEPDTDDQPRSSYLKVIKYPKSCVISFFLVFFLQFSGVTAIMSNMKTIIDESHITYISATALNLVANAAQIAATFVAMFVIDRWGRRLVWVISAAIQLVAFICLWCKDMWQLDGALFIVGLILEQFGYGVGTGPIPLLRIAELFPDDVRPNAMGIFMFFNWILMAIVVFIWPPMQAGMGRAWSFFFYACLFVVSIFFGLYALRDMPITNVDDGEKVEDDDEDAAPDVPEL